MKLIRLILIALLLQPCPVCWGHGLAAMGDAADDESETQLLAPACCSHCSHSRQTPENKPVQKHDEQHDCPCFCHVSEIVFAQTTPAVNLRGITLPLNVVVDLCCDSTQTVVSKSSDAAASSVPITLPLRI